MKHQTPQLPKFKKLKRRLGLTRDREVVGLLETLWLVTLTATPRGDIGRLDNEEIAIELEWDDDPDLLVDALVETGWLDRCHEHRLIVHDWAEHAPRWVHAVAKKKGGMITEPVICTSPTTVADYSSGLNALQSPTTVADCDAEQGPLQSATIPIPKPKPIPIPKRQTTSVCAPSPDGALQSEGVLDFVFPTQSGTWSMPPKKLAEYTATFAWPVEPELRKAALWLREHKRRRPRDGPGISRFLTRWLNRADENHSNAPDKFDEDAWIDGLDLGEE